MQLSWRIVYALPIWACVNRDRMPSAVVTTSCCYCYCCYHCHGTLCFVTFDSHRPISAVPKPIIRDPRQYVNDDKCLWDVLLLYLVFLFLMGKDNDDGMNAVDCFGVND